MDKLMRLGTACNRVTVFGMQAIIVAVIVVTTGTMFLQVVTRYVFQISVSGLDELAGHTAVWLYLMGAAYGAYDRSHIKASVLHLFVKNKRVLAFFDVLAMAIAVIVTVFMTVWSCDYLEWSIRKHEITPTLQLPTVIFQTAIFTGAVLMLIYFSIDLVSRLRKALGHENP